MNARASILHRLADEQWARRECDRVVIDVPRPPSVNSLTHNIPGKGRAKTDRYRTWLRAAGNLLKAQRPGRVSGAYRLTIQVERPEGKRRVDLANMEKAASDLLVTYRVIEDDRFAERVTLEWAAVEGARIIVEKWAA